MFHSHPAREKKKRGGKWNLVQSWPRAEWFQAGGSLAVDRLILNTAIVLHPEICSHHTEQGRGLFDSILN